MQPNTWIFPPGMALYASFNPEVSAYNKEAAGVTLNTGPELLQSFRGVSVYETREFDVRNGELPINLLQRRVQIGEVSCSRILHCSRSEPTDERESRVAVDRVDDPPA